MCIVVRGEDARGAFRGARDTATPLRALSVAAMLNLALDPILIARRGLGWGVAGAAVATTAHVADWWVAPASSEALVTARSSP